MKTAILLIIFLSSYTFMNSQNYTIQAVMTYNFINYLSWEKTDDPTFKIGVYGNSDYTREMKIISKNLKVKDKVIEIIEFNTIQSIKECKILYVSNSKINEWSEILSSVGAFPIVIITDELETDREQSDINFVIKNGNQHFELNETGIRKKNISIDPQLLELALKKNE